MLLQQIELIHILNILLYKYIKFLSSSVYLSFIYQNTTIGCQPFELRIYIDPNCLSYGVQCTLLLKHPGAAT